MTTSAEDQIGESKVTDQTPDEVPPLRMLLDPPPAAPDVLMKTLLLLGLLLLVLSIASNVYLWHLWQQDQAAQSIASAPDPELQMLQGRVYDLSNNLEQMRRKLELYQADLDAYKAENQAIKDEIKAWQDSQKAYKNQIQQQLQDVQNRQNRPAPRVEPQKQNKVTW